MTNNHQVACAACGQKFSISDVTPGRFVRPTMAASILADHPEWTADSYICHNDLNHYRSQYVQNVLTQEKGELTSLEHEVIESLREHDILAQNLNATVAEESTIR